MTQNMGTLDRTVRALLALAVGGLYFAGQLGGVAALILGAFAVIFLGTSAVGSCPLYVPLGLSTQKKS